jgi:hypothetical protein
VHNIALIYKNGSNSHYCPANSCVYSTGIELFVLEIDEVNKPIHYTTHPSGIDCIDVTEHMNFCLGNAIKYIWRVDSKGDSTQNLEKAIWYLKREILRRNNIQD